VLGVLMRGYLVSRTISSRDGIFYGLAKYGPLILGSYASYGAMAVIELMQVVLRCGLALVFLFAGLDKLTHWRESVDEVTGLGLPAPVFFSAATIVTQLIAGSMVATGIGAILGAVALAGFTSLATALGHRFWLLRGQPARHEFTTALEHVAIISGLLLLAVQRYSA
jgi:uncharacterized membrane protein YphA (DoxX/SURF4 family)